MCRHCMLVRVLAVAMRGSRVRLGAVVVSFFVMMCRFEMMMRRGVVLGSRIMMMCRRGMHLGLCHCRVLR